jgi:hypothetical protein
MKKIFILLLLFTTVALSAQDVPSSFPRKFLIEHFTGTWCQYCPYGMFAIDYYIQESSASHIWVSYHVDDVYSTEEGNTIYGQYSNGGVPAAMLNRTAQSGYGRTFNPGYLLEMTINDSNTAEASVEIDHTFNPETHQLDVTVSGQVANTSTTSYQLIVLIKENGLIGGQSDAFYAYGSSWKEFLHPRITRGFLTAANGVKVNVENQAYSQTFTYSVNEKWVPENCCIVAYLTPTTKSPIINAEQVPLVEGTTGGEQYLPAGITSHGAPKTPEKITFSSMTISKPSDDKLKVMLVSEQSIVHSMYNTTLQPVLIVEFNTTENILPIGLFEITSTNAINTLTAGSFDKKELTFSGSRYHYVDPMALQNGEVVPYFTWRLNNGKMKVDEQGNIILAGNFYNEKHFTMQYTQPTTATDNIPTPETYVQKFMRNRQIVIQTNNGNYNVLGNKLQ